MKRFFTKPERILGSTAFLDSDETHHLRDVIRLTSDENVAIFDGEGREFHCRISKIDRDSAELEVLCEIAPTAPESPFDLAIAATILKGDKSEMVVQKAVELGVNTIIPLVSKRCVVTLRESPKRLERWRRIALEATKQCGRARLMSIAEPILFDTYVARADASKTIMFSERDGQKLDLSSTGNSLTAIFGPEGGWDDMELRLAADYNIPFVTLGGRILRAETAAISVAAIIQHKKGDMN